jgi:hypothetical protein
VRDDFGRGEGGGGGEGRGGNESEDSARRKMVHAKEARRWSDARGEDNAGIFICE